MKTNLRFQITNPCEASWDNMQQNDLGSFCLSCNKQVVDFSAMTTDQVIAFWQQPANHQFTCGRFTQKQLNKGFDVDALLHLSPLVKRAAAVTIIGLSMAGLPIELHAQNTQQDTIKSYTDKYGNKVTEIAVPAEYGTQSSKKMVRVGGFSTWVEIESACLAPISFNVSEVQTALQKEGYYKGKIDNVWGTKTQAALNAFKQNRSLPIDNQVDYATLHLLGLMK